MLPRGQQLAGLGVEGDLQVEVGPRLLLVAGLQPQVHAVAACKAAREGWVGGWMECAGWVGKGWGMRG